MFRRIRAYLRYRKHKGQLICKWYYPPEGPGCNAPYFPEGWHSGPRYS